MKKVFTFVLFFIAYIIQVCFLNHIPVFSFHINIFLLMLFLYAIFIETSYAGILGLIAGILIDVSSPLVFGFNALLVMYMLILVSYISNRIYLGSYPMTLLTVFVSFLTYNLLILIFTNFLNSDIKVIYIFLRYVIGESVLNTFVSLFFIKFVKWLKNTYIRGI